MGNIFRRDLLCRSRSGNRIDLLTITNFNSQMNAIRNRPVIILSARVHPGEVNASWIMKGMLDFLLSQNAISSALRNKFVFKIIPCLNPDGVITGNHRCSLSGVDLNRQYLAPSPHCHPSIFYLKKLISTIHASDRRIFFFCDLHGHSTMMNVALYGCSPFDNKSKCSPQKYFSSMDYVLPSSLSTSVMSAECADRYKLFARLLSDRAPNTFNFAQCIWNISKQKEATARAVIWRQFGIQNVYTLESSFCGSDMRGLGNLSGFHFDTRT